MRPQQQKGFTIIEILVTVAIIGILSSVVLASLNDAKQKARIAVAKADLQGVATALVLLANDSREWPGHNPIDIIDAGGANNEVWDLGSQEAGLLQTDGLFSNWKGPYIRAASTTDPWGNPYFFDTDYDVGTSSIIWAVVLGSFGPNGVGQNLYDSDDIVKVIFATTTYN